MTSAKLEHPALEDHARVPLVRKVLADLDTPLSTYLKLADAPYSYLFESVQGGEKWGRYSIIGLPCRRVIKVTGRTVTIEQDGKPVQSKEVQDPLAWIAAYQVCYSISEQPDLPRFTGGLVGYFGYETIGYIEPRLAGNNKLDPIGTPDIVLLVSDEVVVFDNLMGKIYLIVHADPSEPDAIPRAWERLAELEARLKAPMAFYAPPVPEHPHRIDQSDFTSSFSRAGYEAAVERIKHYIVEGDVMQVVPSQRMSIRYQARPLDLYRALRSLNPSPYMYHLNLSDFHIVGSSPEILARLEEGIVTLRPIAGTRPRGADEAADLALERELLADPKELAEHLMLIDLGRNDVGRVAETSSVKVTDKMVIERYSHVMHIVSNVTGQLRKGLSAIDVLRATFPAGTVSGAPKVRAMEIIDELEPVKRGIYSGAVGYLSWSGNMDTAIAIRTAVIKNGWLHVQAGGGIVADSVPAREWEETINKRRAMFRAVAWTEAGLNGGYDEPSG
jgi:anthranilate synthase component 1